MKHFSKIWFLCPHLSLDHLPKTMRMASNNCENLKFDEACVHVRTNDENSNMWFYSLSSDCVSCPYSRIVPIVAEQNISIKFKTVRRMKWRVLDAEDPNEYVSAKNTSTMICELSPNVGQYGLYELSVQDDSCDVKTLKEPTYPYMELFVGVGILIILLLGLSVSRLLWRKLKKKYFNRNEDEGKNSTKRRVKAIDAFRGVSTLLMIFVNDGAGGYPVLIHATWNGLLIGDLVFPCFIWIMGVCVPIALSSQMKRMVPKHTICYSILKRSLLLFLIGVSLNTVAVGPQLENIRIFGVLQRFGVTYFIVGQCYLFLMPKHARKVQSPVFRKIQDITILAPQWCLMILIVLAHSLLTFSLHVPGCPTGYLGPGGRHDDGKYFECAGGSTGYIDKIILKKSHMYQWPLINSVYGSGPFDPEGILGCLTSIFQVFLGVQAGMIMMTYKHWKDRVIRWLLWAMAFGCLGCALHFTNVIPVNKNLWSLSFVFISTSFALAFLSACYLLIDVTRIWRGGPFRIPGMNALVLYVGHILCYKIFPFHWKFDNMDSRGLHLFESIWGVALWTIIAYIMHRKRTYITL